MAAGMKQDSKPKQADQQGEIQPRRQRRSRKEIEAGIGASARKLFAERGYSATTTREIAEAAEVSETLLFRYFGDKARLFEAVIYDPFTQAVTEFSINRATGGHGPDPYMLIFQLLEDNRDLFRALIFGGPTPADGADHPAAGFEKFLQVSIADLKRSHAERDITPDFDVEAGVRLAFGMMASAVLMRDWLFPAREIAASDLVAALEGMVQRALLTEDTEN